jgi:hypothetical protein
MIASQSCHRPMVSPELSPKPNHKPKISPELNPKTKHRPNQPIKRKDNHRGWCIPQRAMAVVPQRTRVVAPHRTMVVAPHRTKELTNRLELII